MKKYKPINCTFYDFIEHYATLKKEIKIEYKDQDDHSLSINSVILDTQNNQDGEFIIVKNITSPIRLDKIISLDGKLLADYLYC